MASWMFFHFLILQAVLSDLHSGEQYCCCDYSCASADLLKNVVPCLTMNGSLERTRICLKHAENLAIC